MRKLLQVSQAFPQNVINQTNVNDWKEHALVKELFRNKVSHIFLYMLVQTPAWDQSYFLMISILENNNTKLNRHLCSNVLYANDSSMFCTVAWH